MFEESTQKMRTFDATEHISFSRAVHSNFLPLFSSSSCTNDFYQIIQNFNSFTEKNIRPVIYLHGILIMGGTLEQILMSRDMLVFLLQHLGFIINFKKSALQPTQEARFLGLTTDTVKMILVLTGEKLIRITGLRQDLLSLPQTTVITSQN